MTSGKTGTIISFATAPGAVAYDGTGKHSPYTQAIADNIDETGLEVTDLFRRVRGDVREATDGNQIAWTTSTLESRFYFKPEGDDLVRTTTGMGVRSDTLGDLPPQRIVDRTIWRSIRDSGRIDAYKAYLRILPDGAFTEDAAQEIRNLGGTLDDVNPIDPLLQDIRSGATARVGATDREEFVSELDRGDVAVAIGTGLVWTPPRSTRPVGSTSKRHRVLVGSMSVRGTAHTEYRALDSGSQNAVIYTEDRFERRD